MTLEFSDPRLKFFKRMQATFDGEASPDLSMYRIDPATALKRQFFLWTRDGVLEEKRDDNVYRWFFKRSKDAGNSNFHLELKTGDVDASEEISHALRADLDHNLSELQTFYKNRIEFVCEDPSYEVSQGFREPFIHGLHRLKQSAFGRKWDELLILVRPETAVFFSEREHQGIIDWFDHILAHGLPDFVKIVVDFDAGSEAALGWMGRHQLQAAFLPVARTENEDWAYGAYLHSSPELPAQLCGLNIQISAFTPPEPDSSEEKRREFLSLRNKGRDLCQIIDDPYATLGHEMLVGAKAIECGFVEIGESIFSRVLETISEDPSLYSGQPDTIKLIQYGALLSLGSSAIGQNKYEHAFEIYHEMRTSDELYLGFSERFDVGLLEFVSLCLGKMHARAWDIADGFLNQIVGWQEEFPEKEFDLAVFAEILQAEYDQNKTFFSRKPKVLQRISEHIGAHQ